MISIAPTGIRLTPQSERVIAKPFLAHTGSFGEHGERLEEIAERVIRLPTSEITDALKLLHARFEGRHRDIEGIWSRHLEMVTSLVPRLAKVSDDQLRQLLGASFTQEYAIEGAALTNPSAVPIGNHEFIVSLRAIGEGHISSIEFRRGRFDSGGQVVIDQPSPYARAGTRTDVLHERGRFASTLTEIEAEDAIAEMVLDLLPDRFSSAELGTAIGQVAARDRVHPRQAETTFHMFHWLASSNYDLVFNGEELSERVLFPAGPADSGGMEDARFVRFVDDDGEVTYYATYTAFDGFRILPQLITTTDFTRFRVSTLRGSCAQNKGMALFPRRINGKYVALSRHDKTNLHVLWTDDVWQWNNAAKLTTPTELWESIQIGNCGSPIETSAGWLVITHGVGPMRTYSLGALLLDLEEPDRVVGRLREPLLVPDREERDGYVPNVVYSCGGLANGNTFMLPYGISDREVGIGLINLDELLAEMV